MQKSHVSESAAVKESSESYEVAFPILSFHPDVQILGQEFGSMREEKGGGGSWADPMSLGMAKSFFWRFDSRSRPVCHVCGGVGGGQTGSRSDR